MTFLHTLHFLWKKGVESGSPPISIDDNYVTPGGLFFYVTPGGLEYYQQP